LFIFGTNRKALKEVIGQLKEEGKKGSETQLSLFVNKKAKKHKLLIPIYKSADYPLIKKKKH